MKLKEIIEEIVAESTEKLEGVYKFEKCIFKAKSYKELVRQMSKLSYALPKNNKEYRKISKNVFWNWDNTKVNDSNDEKFIESLVNSGYIKVLKSPELID